MEEGIRILELASRAAVPFRRQPVEEKRRLLNCVLKGASWQHGSLKTDFRQPFDMLAKTALSNSASDSKENPIEASTGEKEIWLPLVDAFRTFCLAPGAAGRLLFEQVRRVAMG